MNKIIKKGFKSCKIMRFLAKNEQNSWILMILNDQQQLREKIVFYGGFTHLSRRDFSF